MVNTLRNGFASGGLADAVKAWIHRLRFPEDAATVCAEAFPSPPVWPPSGGPRVLLVDDNPANLMVVSDLLERRGITALLAADGAEAVALVFGMRFDFILMDIQMPVLDGLAATARIRRYESMQSRPEAPVVVYGLLGASRAVLDYCGANAVLAKPCSSDGLDACMRRWCIGYQRWIERIGVERPIPPAVNAELHCI
jgi:CheY-like chemotaxis protein